MYNKPAINKVLISVLTGIGIGLILILLTSQFNLTYFVLNTLYGFTFSFVNYLYFENIFKRLSWKHGYTTFVIAIIGSIPLNALTFFLLNLISNMIFFKKSWAEFATSQSLVAYLAVIFISLLISLLIISYYLIKKIHVQQLETERLNTMNERAKLESLKAQLDPHFLFNSLNVLVSLIEENPEKAGKYTMKLSSLYQYVLRHREQQAVPLEEELEFAGTYLSLLKVKYEDDLRFSLPGNDTPPGKRIPPLSLQILLENAVKHNKINRSSPLHIDIEVHHDTLEVRNTITPSPTGTTEGTGLKNLAERYTLLGAKPPEISRTGSKFIVKLPLI